MMYALKPEASRQPEVKLVRLESSMRPELERAAAADGHAVIQPTHAVRRGNEIVGYASLGAVPMFFAWLNSKRLTAPESFRAWRAAEAEIKKMKLKHVCLPCMADSPLLPFVERMGYRPIGTAHIHLKEF